MNLFGKVLCLRLLIGFLLLFPVAALGFIVMLLAVLASLELPLGLFFNLLIQDSMLKHAQAAAIARIADLLRRVLAIMGVIFE